MTFSSTPRESKFVTLKEGDASFQMSDDYMLVKRAGLEITAECPTFLRKEIQWAFREGFIKLVAVVPKDDPTYIWETLRQ